MMSIQFSCFCGKQLQATDDFAGKKMRCPECGQIIDIPAPVQRPEDLPRHKSAEPELSLANDESYGMNQGNPAALPASDDFGRAAPATMVPGAPIIKKQARANSTDGIDQQITPWRKGVQRPGEVNEFKKRKGEEWAYLLLIGLALAAIVAWLFWSAIFDFINSFF